MAKTTKPKGRPPVSPEVRRSKNFTFRSWEALHQQLSVAAKIAGRSISEEIEFRLEWSFVGQRATIEALDLAYGKELVGILLLVAEAMNVAGPQAGFIATRTLEGSRNWLDNPYAFTQATQAAHTVLDALKPVRRPDYFSNETLKSQSRSATSARWIRFQFNVRRARTGFRQHNLRGGRDRPHRGLPAQWKERAACTGCLARLLNRLSNRCRSGIPRRAVTHWGRSMTGHVRRRGKNSFELKFDAGNDPITGKRRIRYTSFKGTKRAAELELARLVSEHDAGNIGRPIKGNGRRVFRPMGSGLCERECLIENLGALSTDRAAAD